MLFGNHLKETYERNSKMAYPLGHPPGRVICWDGNLAMTVYLDLPNPPSVNQYYRMVGDRMLLSAKGRAYKTVVNFEVHNQCSIRFGDAKLKIKVQFHPATKGRVDLDGKLKSLLDALQGAGLFEDDGNVDDLHIVRCEPVKGGRVTVILDEITND